MNDQKTINGKHYWNPAAKTILFGYEVIAVCEHGNGEQKRKHHKRRINKKWLKRYGVWTGQPLDKGKAMVFDGKLFVTHDTYRQIKRLIKSQAVDTTSMYLPATAGVAQDGWIDKLKSFATMAPEKNRISFIPFSEYSLPEADKHYPLAEDFLRFVSQTEINRRVWMSRWFA